MKWCHNIQNKSHSILNYVALFHIICDYFEYEWNISLHYFRISIWIWVRKPWIAGTRYVPILLTKVVNFPCRTQYKKPAETVPASKAAAPTEARLPERAYDSTCTLVDRPLDRRSVPTESHGRKTLRYSSAWDGCQEPHLCWSQSGGQCVECGGVSIPAWVSGALVTSTGWLQRSLRNEVKRNRWVMFIISIYFINDFPTLIPSVLWLGWSEASHTRSMRDLFWRG